MSDRMHASMRRGRVTPHSPGRSQVDDLSRNFALVGVHASTHPRCTSTHARQFRNALMPVLPQNRRNGIVIKAFRARKKHKHKKKSKSKDPEITCKPSLSSTIDTMSGYCTSEGSHRDVHLYLPACVVTFRLRDQRWQWHWPRRLTESSSDSASTCCG